MKKQEQRDINAGVILMYDTALAELESEYGKYYRVKAPWYRLRSCQAWVRETKNFYVLQSYNTIVAVIYKPTLTLYDALRTVYGYSATSAQHIAKFRNDYSSPYATKYTSRDVSD